MFRRLNEPAEYRYILTYYAFYIRNQICHRFDHAFTFLYVFIRQSNNEATKRENPLQRRGKRYIGREREKEYGWRESED